MRKSKKTTNQRIMKIQGENVLGFDEEKNERNNLKKFLLFFIIFLILLYFSTFGITVSFYKGGSGEPQIIDIDPTTSPTQTPTTSPTPVVPAKDQIIFTYSDVEKGGSGINLVNAMPISDTKGKALVGSGNYFDFSVMATSKKNDLIYQILFRKDKSVSTLADSNVRIYLTKVTGNYEEEVILTTFSTLETKKIDGVDYYVLYQKKLTKGISNYSDSYRLRMWVKEEATDYNDKLFKINVDVVAEQVGD